MADCTNGGPGIGILATLTPGCYTAKWHICYQVTTSLIETNVLPPHDRHLAAQQAMGHRQ